MDLEMMVTEIVTAAVVVEAPVATTKKVLHVRNRATDTKSAKFVGFFGIFGFFSHNRPAIPPRAIGLLSQAPVRLPPAAITELT